MLRKRRKEYDYLIRIDPLKAVAAKNEIKKAKNDYRRTVWMANAALFLK